MLRSFKTHFRVGLFFGSGACPPRDRPAHRSGSKASAQAGSSCDEQRLIARLHGNGRRARRYTASRGPQTSAPCGRRIHCRDRVRRRMPGTCPTLPVDHARRAGVVGASRGRRASAVGVPAVGGANGTSVRHGSSKRSHRARVGALRCNGPRGRHSALRRVCTGRLRRQSFGEPSRKARAQLREPRECELSFPI